MGRRLFVSVDVAPRLHDAVADAQAPFADLPGIRCTDPADAHVTVQFIGDVDPDRVDAVREAIRNGTQSVGPFTARFGGLGVFPSFEYISVIWLGVPTGASALTRLHEAIGTDLEASGFPTEDRDYTPHVTIARMDQAEAKSTVQSLVGSRDPDVGTMHVSAIHLKESIEGAHRTLDRVPLSGS